METVAATRNCSMKALPSIAFNEFAGSAGDVTARSVKGRTLLNHKAYQSRKKTPSQAASRNSLSKISRAYKQLTDSQMSAWAVLAEHMKGISTFGDAASMTPHNAFVRINTNRQLVGLPLLAEAPMYVNDVPEPDYEDFWVTPDRLIFIGVEQPQSSYRLVLRMGTAQSNGVSAGWGNLVIVSPDLVPDWGDIDALSVYTDKFGMDLIEGQKYFIEMYWMDTETGFTGESVCVSAICQDLSQVRKQAYTPRPTFNSDQVGGSESMPSFDIEMEGGSGIFSVSVDYQGKNGVASADVEFEKLPDNVPPFNSYVMGRSGYNDYKDYCYCPQTFVVWARQYSRDASLTFAHRGGHYEKPVEIFGSGIMIKQ